MSHEKLGKRQHPIFRIYYEGKIYAVQDVADEAGVMILRSLDSALNL